MKVQTTELPGVLIIEPQVHGDARGFFQETYHAQRYAEAGMSLPFVQDNHSRSGAGVLRGLHYQLKHPQGKLVRVTQGAAFDVAVDIRKGSPTFGKWVGVTLSEDTFQQFYVPLGFAQGFLAMSERVDCRAGATIAIHTEKGSQAEPILDYFRRHMVEPRRLVLCHVSKRPDAGLHSEPIQAGAMLEYDTFFRPKYKPEMYLWPLVEQPTRDGLASGIALATDMAETKLWSRLGEGPGPTGFVILIRSRLRRLRIAQDTIDRLTGGNIADCLARQPD